jgi:TRAP-type mannitol/chloroaromatic compound transport system permease small subunit
LRPVAILVDNPHTEVADARMQALLKLARGIDAMNAAFGRIAVWLVLLACAISAGNAVSRYAFDLSSNAWLELQWYMFAGMVMLGAPFVLNVNGHVRVDIFYGRSAPRTRAWIDLAGLVFFLLPVMTAMMVMSWPFFVESWLGSEMSMNAGGLLRWPVKLVIPLGFALMVLQGIAEIIKRIAFLAGSIEMDAQYEKPLQ